jgi:hypothetical protein
MLSGVEMAATEYAYCCQWVRTDLQNDTVTAQEIYATEPKRQDIAPKRFPATAGAAWSLSKMCRMALPRVVRLAVAANLGTVRKYVDQAPDPLQLESED